MGRRKKHSNKKGSGFKIPQEPPVGEHVMNLEQSHGTLNEKKSLSAFEKLEEHSVSLSSMDHEVKFETYIPNRERYVGREYFVHSLCQVCKNELEQRFPCLDCHLVTYCSEAHQRSHHATHAELCKASRAICKERGSTHLLSESHSHHSPSSPDLFRHIRLQNMIDCATKLQRPLQNCEKEIFIFPNVCGTCYCYEVDRLRVCEMCRHSAFCDGHRPNNHSLFCPQLMLYKRIVKEQNKFGIVCPSVPNSKLSQISPKLTNMDEVFKHVRKYMDDFEFIELTELVTYPLTALSTLLADNKGVNVKKITLHIVGAEAEFETNKLEKWEFYILHLIPTLEHLEIEFVGPELRISNASEFKVCQQCQKANKSVRFKFHNQLYHTLCDSKRLSKPDLICVFNPGLYRSTGFNGQDTWGLSIRSMFSKNCQVLTTAYTHKEVLLDVDRVKETISLKLVKEPCLNPFSSHKPNLNFVSDEESPVIFKNQYFCIMAGA